MHQRVGGDGGDGRWRKPWFGLRAHKRQVDLRAIIGLAGP